jgi:hypothetical protein
LQCLPFDWTEAPVFANAKAEGGKKPQKKKRKLKEEEIATMKVFGEGRSLRSKNK